MKKNDQVYINLQKHLNSQAVGFPATKSGAEINILKHIFTPAEAEIVLAINYKYEPLDIIYSRPSIWLNHLKRWKNVLTIFRKRAELNSK